MADVAIITARGGSKRIPGKNIKDFCGKPIMAYAIAAALDSGLFDEVMVSTDSPEIAEIAKAHGASVPFMRSPSASDDYATTADVLHEVLSAYAEREKSFDFMCCLYPTAPFVTAEKLRVAHTAFMESGADMLEPVVAFSYPPQRSFSIEAGGLRICRHGIMMRDSFISTEWRPFAAPLREAASRVDMICVVCRLS